MKILYKIITYIHSRRDRILYITIKPLENKFDCTIFVSCQCIINKKGKINFINSIRKHLFYYFRYIFRIYYGPHICGSDALEIESESNHILSSSWRRDKSILQVINIYEYIYILTMIVQFCPEY